MTPVGRVARWVPAAAHAAFLFALSAQPDLRFASEPALDVVVRKVGHAGAYAVLAALVSYGLDGGRQGNSRAVHGTDVGPAARRGRRWGLALAIVVAYAVTDEVHQAFVPGRSPSPIDVGIDAVGAVAGLAALRIFLD